VSAATTETIAASEMLNTVKAQIEALRTMSNGYQARNDWAAVGTAGEAITHLEEVGDCLAALCDRMPLSAEMQRDFAERAERDLYDREERRLGRALTDAEAEAISLAFERSLPARA
jgi:hypothetical protein